MNSVIRNGYDADLALVAPGSANLVATGVSTQVDINRITKSVRGALDGKLGELEFDVVWHVVSVDHTTGDETYSLAFNTYDVNGANAVTHKTQAITVTDIGKSRVTKFDGATILVDNANAAFFGLAWTLAGTTPILNFWAFVSSDND